MARLPSIICHRGKSRRSETFCIDNIIFQKPGYDAAWQCNPILSFLGNPTFPIRLCYRNIRSGIPKAWELERRLSRTHAKQNRPICPYYGSVGANLIENQPRRFTKVYFYGDQDAFLLNLSYICLYFMHFERDEREI